MTGQMGQFFKAVQADGTQKYDGTDGLTLCHDCPVCPVCLVNGLNCPVCHDCLVCPVPNMKQKSC